MIYTSGTSRILSLDEANSSDPVGWAVNTDYGHVLFNDSRTKAGWSGNTSNFSYGSGVTLNSNYCTMPVVASGDDAHITATVYYRDSIDTMDLFYRNLTGKMPWFLIAANASNTSDGFHFSQYQDFRNTTAVHTATKNFNITWDRRAVNFERNEFGIGTEYVNGVWKPYLYRVGMAHIHFDFLQFNYLNSTYLNNIWSPSSVPSGIYPLSPNCLRPISFAENMSTSGKAYSDVTNAVFKTSLYADVYYKTLYSTLTFGEIYDLYIGDFYAEYPSGNTYFIGSGQAQRNSFREENVSTYLIMFYAKTVGSCTTSYSGKVSSSGTLLLSEGGGYRGTAPISATANGESVITQTN